MISQKIASLEARIARLENSSNYTKKATDLSNLSPARKVLKALQDVLHAPVDEMYIRTETEENIKGRFKGEDLGVTVKDHWDRDLSFEISVVPKVERIFILIEARSKRYNFKLKGEPFIHIVEEHPNYYAINIGAITNEIAPTLNKMKKLLNIPGWLDPDDGAFKP